MTILIFLIVLLVLVMVHEAGHLVAAKLSKMRVEEFAFGFPPKLISRKFGETDYSINLLPIGGYVKITGESFDPAERELIKGDKKAFQNRPRILQLFVLFAGVLMNLILAFIIFIYLNNTPHLVDASNPDYKGRITDRNLYVTQVAPKSPIYEGGVRTNDIILAIYARNEKLSYTTPEGVVNFVKAHQEDNISVIYKSSLTGNISTTTVRAVFGITEGKKSIGMSVGEAGYIDFDFIESIKEGFADTYRYSKLTLFGLGDIASKLFRGESVKDYLTGPIGIAKLVGTATEDGLSPLLFMVALLSINLAVFNLLPLPALDGGRIVFVIYEMITRKAINFKIQYYINAIGFFGLLLLTLVVTYFDVMR